MLRLLLYSWCRSRMVVRSGGIICMQRNVSTPIILSNFRNQIVQVAAGTAGVSVCSCQRNEGERITEPCSHATLVLLKPAGDKSLQITGRAASAADAPRERRRQAGGRERARGEGEEGSAARSVCGVGASERRGGKRSLEGEGVGTEREKENRYIHRPVRTHTCSERLVQGRQTLPASAPPPIPCKHAQISPRLLQLPISTLKHQPREGKDEKK
ncbi:hypothetical protein DPX16_16193 [Anabarilius grahami]|uniref:SWIM-type domain-containing protein n=1 Tax=Anabarilius grahami TaxID=495550 RepID=A0A3N0XEI3_ANAGA|nr:hypothetical protein DPX16_16193 [Anabarilius grahami]